LNCSSHRGWDLHFWRDRNKEVDFLLHRGGVFDLADAKWTELPTEKDSLVLQQVAEEIGKVKRAALICRAANAYPITKLVHALPLERAGHSPRGQPTRIRVIVAAGTKVAP
jgi:hypothetical protein